MSPDGAVAVYEAESGRVVDVVAPGTNGFVRGVMRGFARERRSHEVGAAPPFRLTLWEAGNLSLEDPTTGRRVELDAFGPTNRQAFERFLTANAEEVLKQFDTLTSMQREVLEFARGERSLFVRRVYLHKFFGDLRRQLELELAVGGEAVALVGTKLLRLGDHGSGADRSLDVADELRPHAKPTGIRYPSAMDVVCLGILVADAIARPVDELPDRGSLGLVDEITLHGGGCALNTASALVRLGLSAGVVGKVGDDDLGAFVLSLLDARGIDRRGVMTDPAVATSASVVLVDSIRASGRFSTSRARAGPCGPKSSTGRSSFRGESYISRARSSWRRSTVSPQRTSWRRRGRVGS